MILTAQKLFIIESYVYDNFCATHYELHHI